MKSFAALRRNGIGVLAFGVVAILTVGFAIWWNQPTVLRLVVPNLAEDEVRLFRNLDDLLRRERAGVRLETVPVESASAAVEAVGRRRAHLALIRPDFIAPGDLRSVALIRREPAILVVPRGRAVTEFANLDGKSVGVVRGSPPNLALMQTLLRQHALASERVTLKPLAYHEVALAVRERRVDALLLVGAPSQRAMQDVVADIAREGRGEPTFLPVEVTEAISGRSVRYEMSEVPRGGYGSAPPRPADAVSTTAIRVHLMARHDADEGAVGELLERLLASRQRLVALENPIAALIEPPDAEADAVLPIHTGARAFLHGEGRGFIDRYSDWFYLILFAGSIVVSGAAWLFGLGRQRERAKSQDAIGRLANLIVAAGSARTAEEIDRIEADAGLIVITALECATNRALDSTDATALAIGMEELRRTLARARRQASAQRSSSAA